MEKFKVLTKAFNHATLFAGMTLFLMCSLLSSCSDDDNDDSGIKGNAESLIIGEWGEVKEESFRNDEGLVSRHPGYKNGKETAWSFGENGKFAYAVYDSKGSYKISGNNLQIECYYWDDPNFTILKLDKDSLIVRHSYPDSEYDYQITYYKRLSFYSEDNSSNLDAEAQKFVGTWSFNRFFWYFAPDGKLYISQNEDVNQENYITEKEWSYDPVTRTMATTVFWNDINPTENYTWGNYNYSWSVLVKEDDFWTGKCLYASGNAATFKKVK